MSRLESIEAPDDFDEFNDFVLKKGWGDGLPVVPPTAELVERHLATVELSPSEVVALLPPRYAEATVESIAANAAMAGARPEYLRVIVAAVRAMSEPSVNLFGIQSTTHSCGLMVMVNGPEATELGVHSGSGVFGPGFRANATIGRAIRLILSNVGGARAVDGTDRSTQGSPAKFSFCFAENEADSPWAPYHVDLGFAPDQSTVTVVGAEAPHNIDDHASRTVDGLLTTVTNSIATMGKNNAYCRGSDYFVAFGPEHARLLADGGFSKRLLQEHLFEHARIPYGIWRRGGLYGIFPQPAYLKDVADDYPVPMSDTADDVRIVVAGGPGRHSAFIPTIAIGRSATCALNGDAPTKRRNR